MIQRRTLKCRTCGHKTTIRTAIGHEDYQEFAFPCGGCGLEIRYGMKLLLAKRVQRLGKKHPGMSVSERLKMLRGQQHISFVFDFP